VPDLTLTATDGTQFKLSNLRGKYVFLDCWASWCGPCVGEIPNVKALREATKNRPDFVMIGVSLDTNKSAFSAALARYSMDWPQAFGPKSGAQEAFDVLDGFGIPYTCLIGPDGKLLAQHLRGPGLDKQVQKYFAEGKEFLPPGNQKYKLRQMELPSQQAPRNKQFLQPPNSQPGGQ
jgi:thiol-disulfide isomerase/thioredoxin